MPRTKFQGVIFGVIMSYAMAIGMEVYNTAIKMGFMPNLSDMTNAVFKPALIESLYMGVLVFLFSNLWGNRLGARFANKYFDPHKDNPYVYRLARQAGTVANMCPTMSLVATILFSYILGDAAWSQFFAIWVGTVLKNFPMAFFWNMFAAAPFSNWLFRIIFPEGKEKSRQS